ncbi:MAG: hypothetical protein KF724_11855 [Phycisphaeraceae bacterium]|nr:hypothetical protein [Phycisphaeraceae bacterium]
MDARGVRWAIHPVIERPFRALAALAAVAALSTAVALFAGEMTWGLIAALALGIALNRAFLVSRYAVEPHGLVIDHPLRRRTLEWESLRRIAFDDSGVLFSGGATRLSIDLPVDADRRRIVIDAIRAAAAPHCEVIDRRAISPPASVEPVDGAAAERTATTSPPADSTARLRASDGPPNTARSGVESR